MQKKMDNELKNKRIGIRLTEELKEQIEAAAAKENRTVSNWCENAIKEKLLLLNEENQKNKE